MTRPRIAFVTPGAFPLPSPKGGSVERVIEKLVPQLAPSVDATIYGRIGARLKRFSMLKGVKCRRYPAADKGKYVAQVAASLRQWAPDLTEVENRPHYVLKLRKLRPSSRLWLHLHSSTFIRPNAILPATLARSFAQTERIIVNSEYLKSDVIRRVPQAAHKVSVVYPGVETERFISQYVYEGAARRAQLRAMRGWEGRSVVLFMGRLLEIKGVHHLLRMLPRLIEQHPSILLVIVGGAFYGSTRTTTYSRMLHRMGANMKRHVLFVPYVPHTEVPDWFLAADVAAVPSNSQEAFGLVNVEAMSCGLPVVATRAGGMKEIIEDGVTGYLVSPERVEHEMEQRLLELLRNDELRRAMGRNSRDRVEKHFTWKHSAERYLNLLQESGLL
ncbi:spore coat protein SA [Paenibacillus phyllosphaerae]|uniref:Spore coat protein SA n=1 Tax=Paenibacillus phyllosphaerae TaxID=274593 RepID=A0A7W5FQU0_9BACL|nr:glycosyltransferase family 4 protein [Paenibacillus phyllosphaerae]MBB3113653.1 spore coat protein SA [Paenibacillus phyllosphaerae]